MVNADHVTVNPVRPAAAYIGGKRVLAKELITLIDALPHDTYAEPFVGMGGVFFRRTRMPPSEVINDASRDVAIFFRILQRHFPQFMDTLKYQLTSRTEFERLSQTDPDTLTDLERAGRFLYLQSLSYGGKVSGRTFGVDPGRSGRFNVTLLSQRLAEIHERMAGVVANASTSSHSSVDTTVRERCSIATVPMWGRKTTMMPACSRTKACGVWHQC